MREWEKGNDDDIKWNMKEKRKRLLKEISWRLYWKQIEYKISVFTFLLSKEVSFSIIDSTRFQLHQLVLVITFNRSEVHLPLFQKESSSRWLFWKASQDPHNPHSNYSHSSFPSFSSARGSTRNFNENLFFFTFGNFGILSFVLLLKYFADRLWF